MAVKEVLYDIEGIKKAIKLVDANEFSSWMEDPCWDLGVDGTEEQALIDDFQSFKNEMGGAKNCQKVFYEMEKHNRLVKIEQGLNEMKAENHKIETPPTVFVLTMEYQGVPGDPEVFSTREKAEDKFVEYVNEEYGTAHETYEEGDDYLASRDDVDWSIRIDDIVIDSTVAAKQEVQNISSADVDEMSKEERVAAVDKLSEIPVLSDDYEL